MHSALLDSATLIAAVAQHLLPTKVTKGTQDVLTTQQTARVPGIVEPDACCAAETGFANACAPLAGNPLAGEGEGWAAAPREAAGCEAAAAAAVAVSTGP